MRSVDLTPFVVGDDDLTLRVEILRSFSKPPKYYSRIWRLEHYRIQSTFPQADGQPAHDPSDQQLLMVDNDLPIERIEGLTANGVFNETVTALKALFDTVK